MNSYRLVELTFIFKSIICIACFVNGMACIVLLTSSLRIARLVYQIAVSAAEFVVIEFINIVLYIAHFAPHENGITQIALFSCSLLFCELERYLS